MLNLNVFMLIIGKIIGENRNFLTTIQFHVQIGSQQII